LPTTASAGRWRAATWEHGSPRFATILRRAIRPTPIGSGTGTPPSCRSGRPSSWSTATARASAWAASHHGRLRLYEANAAVGARTGADLLDLAGKVRYLSVNSGRSELARIRDRARVAELVRQVLAAPVGPAGGRAEDRYCFVVFNLTDRTAVRRAFFPGTGELAPGVFAPPAFTEAVEGALKARGRRCGARA
jgi:hypothetical protein